MAFVSNRKSVLIVGVSGFLGSNLAFKLRHKFLVSGIFFHNPIWIPEVQSYPVQLNSLELLDAIASIQAPQIIINATGIHDPAECKKNEKLAESINVMLPVSIASLASRVKAKFIQLSSSLVYEGKDKINKESSLNFTNSDVLGKFKSTAETYIRSQSMESTILRMGKVLGTSTYFRPSFFDQIRESQYAQKPLHLSESRQENFLSIQSFCSAVEQICLEEFPERHRILNVGSQLVTNEIGLAKEWLKIVGGDPKLLKAIPNDDERNLTMDCSLLQQALPKWKPETKSEIYQALISALAPHVPIKRWQKTLQSL